MTSRNSAPRTRITTARFQRTCVPADAVTASASGLDPEISPASAEAQIARVAKARGFSVETVRGFVARHTAGRTLGVLGEPRVNVLELNLELDQVSGAGGATHK